MPRRALYFSLIVAVIVLFLHLLAIKYYLYWRLWWYDLPLHFLGGIVLGAVAVWFLQSIHERGWILAQYATVATTVAFVFFGGMVWEGYEYSVGFTFNTLGNYPLDVVKDLFVDVAGGLLAWWVFEPRVIPIVSNV